VRAPIESVTESVEILNKTHLKVEPTAVCSKFVFCKNCSFNRNGLYLKLK